MRRRENLLGHQLHVSGGREANGMRQDVQTSHTSDWRCCPGDRFPRVGDTAPGRERDDAPQAARGRREDVQQAFSIEVARRW